MTRPRFNLLAMAAALTSMVTPLRRMSTKVQEASEAIESMKGSLPLGYLPYSHRSITKTERARRNKRKKIAEASRRRNRRK